MRGKCRKGYYSDNEINNIMTYDYKTLLRLDSPLMSIQTQTFWFNSGWQMFLKASLKIWWTGKNENIQNWHPFDQETTYSVRWVSLLINTTYFYKDAS